MIDLHPHIRNLSKDAIHIVQNLGYSMFHHLEFDKLSETEMIAKYSSSNELDHILKLQESKHEADIYILEGKNKQQQIELQEERETNCQKLMCIKEDNMEQIEQLQTKMKEIRLSIDETIKERLDFEKQLYEEKDKNKDTVIEGLQKQMNLYKIMEDKLLEKKEFINPTQQGDYVEKIFDDIVNTGLPYDPKAKIEDTSDSGGSGDRIITFGTGCRLMMEAKNKDTIKKTDMDEFETHYTKDFKENKIDIALLYSHRSPQIPSKCKAIILKQDSQNKNVYYYGNMDTLTQVEKIEKIKQILHELYEICAEKMNTQQRKQKCIGEETNIYNELLEELNNGKLSCENKIKEVDKDKLQYEKKLSEINKKLNKLYQKIQINNISVRKELLDNKVYTVMLRDKIKSWFDTNNIEMKQHSWKKIVRKDMGLSETDTHKIESIKFNNF